MFPLINTIVWIQVMKVSWNHLSDILIHKHNATFDESMSQNE
jgi:hypothetical protein